jgi:hypothetical protein
LHIYNNLSKDITNPLFGGGLVVVTDAVMAEMEGAADPMVVLVSY